MCKRSHSNAPSRVVYKSSAVELTAATALCTAHRLYYFEEPLLHVREGYTRLNAYTFLETSTQTDTFTSSNSLRPCECHISSALRGQPKATRKISWFHSSPLANFKSVFGTSFICVVGSALRVYACELWQPFNIFNKICASIYIKDISVLCKNK